MIFSHVLYRLSYLAARRNGPGAICMVAAGPGSSEALLA